MSIGKRIKDFRELKGWTQTELARRAKLALSAISQFEGGQRNPSTEALTKLSEAFDVPTDYLLGTGSKDDPLAEKAEFIAMHRKLSKMPEGKQDKALKLMNQVLDMTDDG